VAQDAADEIQRLLAEIGVTVAGEQRLAVLPHRHVDVHAGAVVALQRLGHEGGRLAVGVGDVVDHVFVFLDLVGLFGEAREDQAQLVLARGDLVVVLVHLHADALHGRQHLRAQVLRVVDRVDREIAALDARAMAAVALLERGVGVPRAVDRVDLVGHLVHRHRKADVVEDEELGLGAEEGGIADPGGLEIGLGLLGGRARVAAVGLAGVGLDHRAMHAQRLFGVERIDIGRIDIRHQLHVRLVDRLPAGDRRAVEHEAFLEEFLVDDVDVEGDVLQLAARVGEAQIDIGDVFVPDQFHDLRAHEPSPSC